MQVGLAKSEIPVVRFMNEEVIYITARSCPVATITESSCYICIDSIPPFTSDGMEYRLQQTSFIAPLPANFYRRPLIRDSIIQFRVNY